MPTTSSYKRKRIFAKNKVYDCKLREMGKDAYKMWPTAAARKYSARLTTKINESTMCGIKRAYLEARGQQDNNEPVTTLPPKKQGRPLLLGKTLDVAMHDYILKLRERPCTVNTDVAIAAARGILKVMDPSRLAKNSGLATLSVPWAKSLLHQMNFTKRRGSTKGGIPSDDLEGTRETFLTDIIETVALNVE